MRSSCRVVGLSLVMCLTSVMAVADNLTAYESVKKSTDLLLARLVEAQPDYETDPDKFFRAVELALDPYIDFEGFAKNVMAKHYRNATVEQRNAFRATFRKALIKTYGTALVEFDNEKIIILKPGAPPKKPDRARIDLEVHAKSGTIYPVRYQLVRKDGRWLLRNVILNGINIGLQFRTQFASFMQKYKKNMGQVIENWSVDDD